MLSTPSRCSTVAQVMDMQPVLNGTEAQVVGRADHLATLHPATGHPHRESGRVVVAAVSPSRSSASGRTPPK